MKLRPQSKTFLDIANPKAVLENTLRSFSALTKGETIRIIYNKKEYDIDVVDVQPRERGAICIVDADVNVDFDGKFRVWVRDFVVLVLDFDGRFRVWVWGFVVPVLTGVG